MKTKTGRNEPCPCGSGQKYKRCCGASRVAAISAPVPPDPSSQQLEDRRYLLGLDTPDFMTELVGRLRTFAGKDVPAPSLDFDDEVVAYDGVIRVLPMIHRPTAGWAGIPKDVIEVVRQAQIELVACLEDLAARESIVVVAEGFQGNIDSALFASDALSNPDLLAKGDGYGLLEFIVKNPHVPVVGGDIPEGVQAIHEMIMRLGTQMPSALRVYNALQEFRNRYAVRAALHAATSLQRTPVVVFGVDHTEGIAHAARKVAARVQLTLTPVLAVQGEHLFDAASPLRL